MTTVAQEMLELAERFAQRKQFAHTTSMPLTHRDRELAETALREAATLLNGKTTERMI